jgi:hypothetical protein
MGGCGNWDCCNAYCRNAGCPSTLLVVNPDSDPFLRSLADLEEALAANQERAQQMRKRIRQIRSRRQRGESYRDIVEGGKSPLIVGLLRESGRAMDEAGARVRRTEALALHDEGMTMEQIAERFGVTRQRVSSLLRDARQDPS